jgi:hypothetical protein
VFEGALVSALSLGLASLFSLIISYVRSYYNTTTLCSHYYLLLGYEPSLSFIAQATYSNSIPSDRAGAILRACSDIGSTFRW